MYTIRERRFDSLAKKFRVSTTAIRPFAQTTSVRTLLCCWRLATWGAKEYVRKPAVEPGFSQGIVAARRDGFREHVRVASFEPPDLLFQAYPVLLASSLRRARTPPGMLRECICCTDRERERAELFRCRGEYSAPGVKSPSALTRYGAACGLF